jgi:hypothetical protein
MTTEAKRLGVDFERREPRCRICRDEGLRMLANRLLDWRGTPILVGRKKAHVVTYADILRDLNPINACRDHGDQITYSSLWVHAKRHHDVGAVAAYQMARMVKELVKSLGSSKVATK